MTNIFLFLVLICIFIHILKSAAQEQKIGELHGKETEKISSVQNRDPKEPFMRDFVDEVYKKAMEVTEKVVSDSQVSETLDYIGTIIYGAKLFQSSVYGQQKALAESFLGLAEELRTTLYVRQLFGPICAKVAYLLFNYDQALEKLLQNKMLDILKARQLETFTQLQPSYHQEAESKMFDAITILTMHFEKLSKDGAYHRRLAQEKKSTTSLVQHFMESSAYLLRQLAFSTKLTKAADVTQVMCVQNSFIEAPVKQKDIDFSKFLYLFRISGTNSIVYHGGLVAILLVYLTLKQ